MRNSNHKLVNNQKRKEYLGKCNFNSKGERITLIEYTTAKSVKVQFDDGTIVNTCLGDFTRGSIRKPINNRVGVSKVNNQGDLMSVIEYNNSADITIQFQDSYGFIKNTTWSHFIDGSIKNPYHPTIAGGNAIVGCELDWGKYFPNNTKVSKSKEYAAWCNVLGRCFNPGKSGITYMNCTLDPNWLYFWNFLDWVCNEPNYLMWGRSWAIDKDILIPGNKKYGPDTCLLVPKHINNLLLDHGNARGNYSIGVSRRSDGLFEASNVYQIEKCKVIRKVALKSYNNKEISYKCLVALINRSNENAHKLNIPIISEEDLIKIVENANTNV